VGNLKKSYSGLNLLQKKLSGVSGEYKNFIDFFLTNRKYLTLKIPYYDYLRGIIFLDDMRDNYGKEFPLRLDIASLIFILFDDFLVQIKRGAKNQDIAAYLLEGIDKYFHTPKKEQRVMKALSKHLLQFETVAVEYESDHDEIQTEKNKHAYLEIRIRETDVLRAEVLIHELHPFLSEATITVEELMTIIYLDFIETIKNDGNSENVQISLINRVSNNKNK
jgi:hypothetical protein